jgi:hypothetical protein
MLAYKVRTKNISEIGTIYIYFQTNVYLLACERSFSLVLVFKSP